MAGGVQSIERAFAILRALAVGPSGVTDLAEKVDLPKSTISRLLSALEAEGVVGQAEVGGVYQLGSSLADLAGASAPGGNLVAAARPFLIDLTELTNETSGVSVIDHGQVYYLEHVEASLDVQVRDWTGEHAPLHAVPSGIVLLAHSSPQFLSSYLAGPLDQTTAKTVTDPATIRQRCADALATGYVWGYEEFADGINSVAAVVLGEDGTPQAGLHVHGPSFRFPESGDEDKYGRLVADAADKLSAQLRD